MRILVVEDDSVIGEAVASSLRIDGHAVDLVGDGREALDWLETYPYDLVILDIVLPGDDGLTILARLRARPSSPPVLLLTALGATEDRVAGLDAGADDYLVKPFAMAELRARVRALARRRDERRQPRLTVGDLELDPATMGVWRRGRSIRLTPREFALLELLARHPGQVLSRDRITDVLWDAASEIDSNVLEVYVRSLRRKLDGGRRDGLIETIRGLGYRLRAPTRP